MDKSRSETDPLANLFKAIPEGEGCSLPMPRFGKTPASAHMAQSLPDAGGNGHETFRLSPRAIIYLFPHVSFVGLVQQALVLGNTF
jgi:hypothetical protein